MACAGCRHFTRLTQEYLLEKRVPPQTLVLDLAPRLRCNLCNELGRGMVSVEWAEPGYRSILVMPSTVPTPATPTTATVPTVTAPATTPATAPA